MFTKLLTVNRHIRPLMITVWVLLLSLVATFTAQTAANPFLVDRAKALDLSYRLTGRDINTALVSNETLVNAAQTADFGDAPASYGDASAEIREGFSLGNEVDGEAGSLYTVAADGDDLSGRDDEDGVYVVGGGRYNRLGQPGEAFLMVIAAQVPSRSSGFVHCWIDFDRSGVFDLDESMINGAPVSRSNAAITSLVTIPNDAVTGVSYLRCHLTDATTGGDTPTGAVGAGEVEDYLVIIEGSEPVLTSSLGSTVFLDADNDGVHEAGEPGLPGVTVELYAAGPDGAMGGGDDTLLASTATDLDGNYFFDQLLPGKYYMVIPTPPIDALKSSDPTDTTDNQIDGDDNGIQPGGTGTAIHSPVILLSLGGEPVGAAESGVGGLLDDVFDADGDMTVDFGLVDVEPFPSTNTPTPTGTLIPVTPTSTPTPPATPSSTPLPG